MKLGNSNYGSFGVLTLLLLVFLSSCRIQIPAENLKPYEYVNQWVDMTLYITKNTGSNSPTFASRCLGYIGLTMYESVVPGFPEYQSITSELNGMPDLTPIDSSLSYNWLISMNAAQSRILKNIYAQTSDSNKVKIDKLEADILVQLKPDVQDGVVSRSIEYGQKVADQIFEWSQTDGGHRAYLRNFDKEWVHPVHPGAWQPPLFAQSFSHHPLHPHWGENRTFLKANSEISDPYMIPYDSTVGSDYYNQFLQVYNKDLTLTQAEKEAALWWGDDPDETFTPPGHSYYLTSQLIEVVKPNLITTARAYAQVGMAVADAFRNCWKWKYDYFSERPNTFIPKFIDERWESFWPDPPFPAFPSGHAINASACATVLIDLFGNDHQLVDRSHVGRERDEVRNVDFVERKFQTIWGIAEETANSRFYGGIHVPQDNEVGLEKGRIIAKNVNQLKWKK